MTCTGTAAVEGVIKEAGRETFMLAKPVIMLISELEGMRRAERADLWPSGIVKVSGFYKSLDFRL